MDFPARKNEDGLMAPGTLAGTQQLQRVYLPD
jgi:hypothetical protein